MYVFFISVGSVIHINSFHNFNIIKLYTIFSEAELLEVKVDEKEVDDEVKVVVEEEKGN